ncbi:MAG: hypothetical protein K8R69_05565 [Deltaproteobacteria bacterium]|nr:hypothetical protein [Deltaproteobacteria bacterium]
MYPPSARGALASPASVAHSPLRGRLSEIGFLEFSEISKESDTLLREEGILNLAQREEIAGHLDSALDLYATIESVELQSRVQTRIDAILGRGATGPRAEFLLRRLSSEATSPAAIAGIALGGAVFQFTKAAVLTRLAGSPLANLLTRGAGARLLAATAGFAIEAPTFTLATRTVRAATGEDLSNASLTEEIASSYLLLGAMKTVGAFGTSLSSRLSDPRSMLASAFRQGSALGGLLLGRRLEEWAGLKTPQSGATTLIDSLAMLLQFHVGARLNKLMFGPGFSSWERELQIRTDNSSPPAFPLTPERTPGFDPLPAEASGPRGHGILMMSENSKPPSSEPPTQVYSAPETMRVDDLYNILLALPRVLKLPRPVLIYDGEAWREERDAAAIAGRLRRAIPLPIGKTFELELRQQGRRLHFYWEDHTVKFRAEEYSPISQKKTAPPPQPISTAETLPAMAAVQAPASPRSAGLYRFRFDAANPVTVGEASPTDSNLPASFGGLRPYELEMNRRIEDFYRQHVPKDSGSTPWPEEASALRGRRLARIANLVFRPENTGETARSLPAMDSAAKIQCFLEHAYRHLDFDTLRTFRERLQIKTTEAFEETIQLLNLRLEREGAELFLLPEEMPLDLGASHLVPRTPVWRDAFLGELFRVYPEKELLREIPGTLGNPRRMAALLSPVFQRRLQEVVSNGTQLQTMLPRDSLKELLHHDRSYRSDSAKGLQLRVLEFLKELPEFSRILVEGRGKPHREFLRVLFFDGETNLQRIYPSFLQLMEKVPPESRGLDGRRLFLPSLAQIRDFTQASRPPKSR